MLRKEQSTPQSRPLLFQASEGFPCVPSTLNPRLSSLHAREAVCTRTANSHELRRAESTANSPQAGVPSWSGDLSVNDQCAPHRHWSLSEISPPGTGGSCFQARICGDSLGPCRRAGPGRGEAIAKPQNPNKSFPQLGRAPDCPTPSLHRFGTPVSS